MQLKASTDYALRAVLYLALEGKVTSSKKISEDIAVPRDYLIQLSQLLRNAGIIEARAGKNGGYVLAKDLSQITFLEVMRAIEEGTKSSKADPLDMDVVLAADKEPPLVEGLHKALDLAFNSFDAYLDSITIEMLANCAKDAEHIDFYLAERLIEEGKRLEMEAEDTLPVKESAVIPNPKSVTVIPVEPFAPPAAVASAAEVPSVESKSPAAQIESKTALP